MEVEDGKTVENSRGIYTQSTPDTAKSPDMIPDVPSHYFVYCGDDDYGDAHAIAGLKRKQPTVTGRVLRDHFGQRLVGQEGLTVLNPWNFPVEGVFQNEIQLLGAAQLCQGVAEGHLVARLLVDHVCSD